MQVCYKHQSYRFCVNLNETFETMFPDSDITLGKTKIFYVINDGLSSYFLTKPNFKKSWYSSST